MIDFIWLHKRTVHTKTSKTFTLYDQRGRSKTKQDHKDYFSLVCIEDFKLDSFCSAGSGVSGWVSLYFWRFLHKRISSKWYETILTNWNMRKETNADDISAPQQISRWLWCSRTITPSLQETGGRRREVSQLREQMRAEGGTQLISEPRCSKVIRFSSEQKRRDVVIKLHLSHDEQPSSPASYCCRTFSSRRVNLIICLNLQGRISFLLWIKTNVHIVSGVIRNQNISVFSEPPEAEQRWSVLF